MNQNYKFFNHKDCEYFPCHKTNDPDNFNCLFCYCPLYALKDKCGGNFRYTDNGIKDCSNCFLPHRRDNYDYIIIDCMPSLGMLTINALSAADSVLIPVQPQYYAADGLVELLSVVKGIKQRFNPGLEIEGILFTMDSSRYNNSKRNKQAVKMAYGKEMRIFEKSIPRSEAIAETASEGVSIFAYDSRSKGAKSYAELAEEVLNHA